MTRLLVGFIALMSCVATLLGAPVSSALDVGRPTVPSIASPVAAAARLDDAVPPVFVRGLSPVSARAGVPGRTRVLVMRIYWSGKPPKTPDDAEMRGLMKETAAWFKRVSRGRHHLTSKVTPWLKVGGGDANCGDLRAPAQRAIAAARKRGFGTGGFNRFMVVSPQCGATSFGEKPGRVTWIREAHPYTAILVHELGHNLGLDHANSLICTAEKRRVTEGGKCISQEYGDMWDAMGLSSRSYSVAVLKRLGWAGRVATATGSGTWTLRDAEHSGSGLQGLQVKAGKDSYWLEYRTDPHALDDTPGTFGGISGTPGLEIRLDTGGRSMHILDASPGDPDSQLSFPDPDFVNVALPVGSSFTTPQRVRITLESQTATTAKVRITRGKAARAPDAPTVTQAVSASAQSGNVTLKIVPGDDNGQVVLGYVLTKYPSGKTTYVSDPGGAKGSYDVYDPGGGVGPWSARAVNQVGTSPESARTLVHVSAPTITITSPAAGAFVPGPSVPIAVVVTPDSISNAAISQVVICLDTGGCQTDKAAPYAVTVSGAISGPNQIMATATDVDGAQVTVKVPVTVVDSPPSVLLGTPPNNGLFHVDPNTGAAVVAVSATAAPNASTASPVTEVSFAAYDLASGSSLPSDYVTVPAGGAYQASLYLGPGNYRVEAVAVDANGYSSAPSVAQISVVDP